MSIPIVGQPGEVIFFYPTTLFWCKCVPGALNILVITGLKNYVSCGRCGNLYCIDAMIQNPTTGAFDVQVGVMLPTPKGEVM